MSGPAIRFSIRNEFSSHDPLSYALASWRNTQSQDPDVYVYAPHVLRLVHCGSIAINRYCAIVGKCQNIPPTSASSHTILGMDNHPTFYETLQIIRDFLETMNLRKTLIFKIENCLGPDGKISICTILVAIWRFTSSFREEGEPAESFQTKLAQFFESKDIKITQSEIKAVLNGGQRSVYINHFLKDVFDIIQYGRETPIVSETVVPFFDEFDFIFLRTNSSNTEESSDHYFNPSFVKDIKMGFDELNYNELDNMDIDDSEIDSDSEADSNESNRNEFRVIYNVLSRISESRIKRPEFAGSSVERNFQRVLEKLIDETLDQQIVRGGYASNEGLLLIAGKQSFEDVNFHKLLTNAFLQCAIHPSFINLEKLQGGKAAHASNHFEREDDAITNVNIIPNFYHDQPSSPPPILHIPCHKGNEQRLFMDDSVELPEYEPFAIV